MKRSSNENAGLSPWRQYVAIVGRSVVALPVSGVLIAWTRNPPSEPLVLRRDTRIVDDGDSTVSPSYGTASCVDAAATKLVPSNVIRLSVMCALDGKPGTVSLTT